MSHNPPMDEATRQRIEANQADEDAERMRALVGYAAASTLDGPRLVHVPALTADQKEFLDKVFAINPVDMDTIVGGPRKPIKLTAPPEPDVPRFAVPIGMQSRIKNLQYAVAYDAHLEPLRGEILELLTLMRGVVAKALPLGSTLPKGKRLDMLDDLRDIQETVKSRSLGRLIALMEEGCLE